MHRNRIWYRVIQAFVVAMILVQADLNVATAQSTVRPLPRAHAHNDYEHNRPLLDALEQGFCSVEADVFLVNDQLLVGHNRWSLNPERTLRKLYLEPLQAMVTKNGGRVFKDGPMFTLLIDFKSNGEQIYPVLKRQLEPYREMLSGLRQNKYETRAIQIVISGACPRALIKADDARLVSIDGRLKDLSSDAPSHLMPLISDRWGSHFKWRGKSPLPKDVKEKLKSIVDSAHGAGRRVRFWATPESPIVWDALIEANVDHINTDKLKMLNEHLLKSAKSP